MHDDDGRIFGATDGETVSDKVSLEPSPLLVAHSHLLERCPSEGPILDLACGKGHNGIFLAKKGFHVVLCDVSEASLQEAERLALAEGVQVTFWAVDLEQGKGNPFEEDAYGAICVFRYLHRPLFPCIKKALCEGGLLFYETFTVEQAAFGRPKNPDYLLRPGELKDVFQGWKIHHYFEGIEESPKRAIAQIICQKTGKGKGGA